MKRVVFNQDVEDSNDWLGSRAGVLPAPVVIKGAASPYRCVGRTPFKRKLHGMEFVGEHRVDKFYENGVYDLITEQADSMIRLGYAKAVAPAK